MRKFLLTLTASFAVATGYSQNSFPVTGDVALGNQGYLGNAILFQGWGETHLLRSESFGNMDNGHTRLRMYLRDDWAYDQGFEVIASRWDGPQRSLLYIPGDGSNASFYNGATFAGSVGIGTRNPDALLAVKGTIHSQEVKVDMNGWADYVFKPTYKLPPLANLKAYIEKNQHLPEMPSEAEVATAGVNLGEMVKLQTKKIEELTLYLIEKDKQLTLMQQQITRQQYQIKKISKKLK